MIAWLRLFFITLVIGLVTLALAPIQTLLIFLWPGRAGFLPMIWHRVALFLIGVRVHLHGHIVKDRPLLIVANHISWADILVLGSIAPLSFIAKDEVSGWPGISILSQLQRTIYVNRERRREAGLQASSIASRLNEGDVMVLFAEGTTSDGHRLLPFKSSLFGALKIALEQNEDKTDVDNAAIQPVAIAYNRLHGMALGRYHQTLAAWPGDIELAPHLKRFLLEGAFDVDVSFGTPLVFDRQSNRKHIAKQSYDQTRTMFSRSRRLEKKT